MLSCKRAVLLVFFVTAQQHRSQAIRLRRMSRLWRLYLGLSWWGIHHDICLKNMEKWLQAAIFHRF